MSAADRPVIPYHIVRPGLLSDDKLIFCHAYRLACFQPSDKSRPRPAVLYEHCPVIPAVRIRDKHRGSIACVFLRPGGLSFSRGGIYSLIMIFSLNPFPRTGGMYTFSRSVHPSIDCFTAVSPLPGFLTICSIYRIFPPYFIVNIIQFIILKCIISYNSAGRHPPDPFSYPEKETACSQNKKWSPPQYKRPENARIFLSALRPSALSYSHLKYLPQHFRDPSGQKKCSEYCKYRY